MRRHAGLQRRLPPGGQHAEVTALREGKRTAETQMTRARSELDSPLGIELLQLDSSLRFPVSLSLSYCAAIASAASRTPFRSAGGPSTSTSVPRPRSCAIA